MNRRLWKFPLVVGMGSTRLLMPYGARIVHVAMQGDAPTLWALVDADLPERERAFVIRGTGEPVSDDESYVGTVFYGPLVLHVFEVFA